MKIQGIKKLFISAVLIFSLCVPVQAASLQFNNTIDFTDGDSGYVQLQSLTYGVGYGYANCSIAANKTTGLIKRAVFRFATAPTIPSNATVTKVEFFTRTATVQPSPIISNSSGIWMGAWIGAQLTASSGDYTASGSTNMGIDPIYDWSDGSWNDMSTAQDATVLVVIDSSVNSGNTDIQFRSTDGINNTNGYNWNTNKSKCQLRVTYTVPIHGLPSVGVGSFLHIRGIDLKKGVVIFRATFNPIGA